jgi:hypothetical protein
VDNQQLHPLAQRRVIGEAGIENALVLRVLELQSLIGDVLDTLPLVRGDGILDVLRVFVLM